MENEQKLMNIEAAEALRQSTLKSVYVPKFQGLSDSEKIRLARSGKVWWDYSQLENRKVYLSQSTLDILSDLDRSRLELQGCNLLQDDFWKRFCLAITHHSTALEGNKLSESETAMVLKQFYNQIVACAGVSRADLNDVSSCLPKNDVIEVINHAAALEYAKRELFSKQEIKTVDVCRLYRILMPDDEQAIIAAIGLSDDHGVYRKLPIKVRGSPAVRPYPQEVPQVMENIFRLHYEKHIHQQHPVVACFLFMANFAFVHPFPDGNGRISRLIMQAMLYNAGYYGCLIRFSERRVFMSSFDTYFTKNDFDVMAHYLANRTIEFHKALTDWYN